MSRHHGCTSANLNERSCRRLLFFQVNPFHVDSGDTLFGGPKVFDGSLAYVNDSFVGVEVVLAGLRGRPREH